MKYKIPYLAFVALMVSMMFGCANGRLANWSPFRHFRGADCNTCNPPTTNHGCNYATPNSNCSGNQPAIGGQVPFGNPITPYGSDPYGNIVPPNSNILPGPVNQ